MASLKGKVIAITGAASGIGLQVARIIAARGARLALADVQEKLLNQLVEELRTSSVAVIGSRVDVSSRDQVDSWINKIVKHYGELNGAVNFAGVEGHKGAKSTLVDLPDDEWDFILSVNLTGLMYCVRAQLQKMKEGSSIVNAASIVGMVGRPGMVAYAVSKHGVVGLTKSVAREAGNLGIRVNAVAP